MLTALILICSIAATPDLSTCTPANAASVISVPEAIVTPYGCGPQAQAYLAETSIGRDLRAGDVVKVVCERRRTAP